jgi:hypothetical protein
MAVTAPHLSAAFYHAATGGMKNIAQARPDPPTLNF